MTAGWAIVPALREGRKGNLGNVWRVPLQIHASAVRYRVYFIQRGPVLIILLCGGDKSSQDRDIKQAKVLAEQWKG